MLSVYPPTCLGMTHIISVLDLDVVIALHDLAVQALQVLSQSRLHLVDEGELLKSEALFYLPLELHPQYLEGLSGMQRFSLLSECPLLR